MSDSKNVRIALRAFAAFVVACFVAACEDDNGASDGTTTTSIFVGSTTTEPTTTVTLPTTTVAPPSTTTTTSTTSSTVIVCDVARSIPRASSLGCAITFGVATDVTLGALQFDVAYDDSIAHFEGDADQVVCTDLTGSLASFNHDAAGNVLHAGLISLAGIPGPRDVVRCNVINSPCVLESWEPSDLTITVVDAADPNLNPVTAEVEVADLTCTPVGPPSTTTTTVVVP